VYATMAFDIDTERCERFKTKAREFALSFWRYFDTNGKKFLPKSAFTRKPY
jgi:hypothetical protein